MNPVSFLFLLLLAPQPAACSCWEVDLRPGETRDYVLQGRIPRLHLDSGQAEILSVDEMAEGLFLVELHCLASSPPCHGTLDGCERERREAPAVR